MSGIMEKRLKRVSRAEYGAFIRSHNLTDKPVEGFAISVMQHVDSHGVLMAQAIYYRGAKPYYEIGEL